VNKPSGKKGISNATEALRILMDQVKIILENLQMVDPSVIFLPHKDKDTVGMESDLIATAEHVCDNYDRASISFNSMTIKMTCTCTPMCVWPSIHHTKSCSGKVVKFCTANTRPCIPDNFKRKIVSLYVHLYTHTEICRAKGLLNSYPT
jgi:hypothetical protein